MNPPPRESSQKSLPSQQQATRRALLRVPFRAFWTAASTNIRDPIRQLSSDQTGTYLTNIDHIFKGNSFQYFPIQCFMAKLITIVRLAVVGIFELSLELVVSYDFVQASLVAFQV